MRQAEANHPKLRGSLLEQQAAAAKRLSKRGAFDPVMFAGTDYLRYNSTSTRGKPLDTTMSDIGVELPFRNGFKIIAGTQLNVGSPKQPESSTGDGGEWNVSLKASLGRGSSINDKTAGEQQAVIGESVAAQSFALTRLDVLQQAAVSYWDWVGAAQKVVVARDLLALAETRAAQIQRRFVAGDLPEIDAVEARGEVFRRQGSLAKAERDRQKASFKLTLYLWDDNIPDILGEQASPAFPPITVLSREAIAEGRKRVRTQSPQVRAAQLQQSLFKVDERLAENDRQPTIDLVLNPGLDTGAKSIGDTAKVGISFSLPLNLWEATGRRDEARAKREKSQQEERLSARQAQTGVDDAAGAVEATRLRYAAAQEEVALAVRLEQAERKRYELGEGNLFLVNQRERASAESRQRLIEVQVEYHQAAATFRAAILDL